MLLPLPRKVQENLGLMEGKYPLTLTDFSMWLFVNIRRSLRIEHSLLTILLCVNTRK